MGQCLPVARTEGQSARRVGENLGALEVGGLFYASFKEGENDGRDTIGRYYNYPSEDWLRACYCKAGRWSFRPVERSNGKGFDGTPATMMHVVVQKSAP